MQNLMKVQKVCRVFKVLVTVAMVICFVASAAMLFSFISMYAFESEGIFQMIAEDVPDMSREEMLSNILSMFVSALLDAVLLAIARSYLVLELREKTPFTAKGADRLRNLGIICIVMPIVASIISSAVYAYYGVDSSSAETEGAGIIVGIVLIVASVVLRYGSDLEQYVRSISVPVTLKTQAPEAVENERGEEI